ncbi:MAG: hypothetical protein WCS97_00080 [Candidatus Paceibacterota bacterium]|jgi:hypothetical protein
MRLALIAIFVFFTLAPTALAQITPVTGKPVTPTPIIGASGQKVTLINPLKGIDCSSSNGDCLMAFLNSILKFVVRIGAIAVVLMLVYIGFLYVKAQGNPGKLEEAHKALLWTVIGALILLGAQAIQISITATVQALGG